MAARALASVMVTFGMVSIPVKLYAATQAQAGVSFNLLHAACGSRLKQQYLCAREGVVVERADMVKGYEFAKDQYVTFTRGGVEGAGGEGHADDRDQRVRASGEHRSDLLRQGVLPRARQGRRQALRAARGKHAPDRPDGSRPLCGTRQAVHRPVARRLRAVS